MKVRDVLAALGGGWVIYVAMVACNGGADAPFGSGGSTGSEDAGDIIDALTDPVPDANAEPVSGSRLKARYIAGEDGSKSYLPGQWYDTERQENCFFQTAADGKKRCLPAETLKESLPYFIDAACTATGAYRNTPACTTPPPDYALTYSGPVCSTVVKVHQVGAQHLGPVYYIDAFGQCSDLGDTDGWDFFSLGAEIPPTEFVAGAEAHD